MGQRLVITVKNNGESLLKAYFHWSAYTVSAITEASNLIKGAKLDTFIDNDDIIISCCVFQSQGGWSVLYPISQKRQNFREVGTLRRITTGKSVVNSRNSGLCKIV